MMSMMYEPLYTVCLRRLQHNQILGGLREYHTAIGGNSHGILYSDTTETGDIDTGFNGEDHSLLNNSLTALRYNRLFMNLQPDTVSQSVTEIGVIPLFPDIVSGNCIKVTAAYSRPDRRNGPVMRLPDNLVDLPATITWAADCYGHRLIRMITVFYGTKIDCHQFTGAQHLVGCPGVRHCATFSRGHDKIERTGISATATHLNLQLQRNVGFP